MHRITRVFLGAALILGCAGLLIAGALWRHFSVTPKLPVPTASLAPGNQTPLTSDTAKILAGITLPPRDSRALAERLRPANQEIPAIVNPQPPQNATGDKARFWVSNSDSRETFQITATLRSISKYTEMWVQDGINVDQKGLEQSAKEFDERIYPTVHQYFGSEWTPGVDNNPRVIILNARFSGAAGYYSSHDEFSRRVNPYSNEREMFYMNVDAAIPGSERYAAILAHEFQHMVHWNVDSNEDSWVNEGAAELAARLCGYGVTGSATAFAMQPDTQLSAWSQDPNEDSLPHYGASYLWLEYFLQRQGADSLKTVLAEQNNGIASFEQVLGQKPGSPSFDDLFADWVIANLLDDQVTGGGRYGHQSAAVRASVESTRRNLPFEENSTVNQYGTDYIVLTPRNGPLKIEFWGTPGTTVVPNSPFQGRYEWWSNRGDMSNTTLTRAFDLTGVKQATLQYNLWYALEDGWDYGYIEVSTDNGATWTLLTTGHTSTYDPNGNGFGPGYTGFSSHPAGSDKPLKPAWIQEKVDLTPYAGKRILVRFEVVTDDAVNLPGLCIDDISVPELKFKDDAESEQGSWQAAGFVRMDNTLPQQFLVQVIRQGKQMQVERLHLDEQQHGVLVVDNAQGADRVVLAISGLTRYTTEPARYRYSVSEGAR